MAFPTPFSGLPLVVFVTHRGVDAKNKPNLKPVVLSDCKEPAWQHNTKITQTSIPENGKLSLTPGDDIVLVCTPKVLKSCVMGQIASNVAKGLVTCTMCQPAFGVDTIDELPDAGDYPLAMVYIVEVEKLAWSTGAWMYADGTPVPIPVEEPPPGGGGEEPPPRGAVMAAKAPKMKPTGFPKK